jgi:hypothetical protein
LVEDLAQGGTVLWRFSLPCGPNGPSTSAKPRQPSNDGIGKQTQTNKPTIFMAAVQRAKRGNGDTNAM